MNTDNNQNKQLTELSDEELKQVNGGTASSAIAIKAKLGAVDIELEQCPGGEMDVNGKCPQNQ